MHRSFLSRPGAVARGVMTCLCAALILLLAPLSLVVGDQAAMQQPPGPPNQHLHNAPNKPTGNLLADKGLSQLHRHDALDGLVIDARPAVHAERGAVGSVRVVDAETGAAWLHLRSERLNDFFGYATTWLGDINGDGWPDLAIGIPNAADPQRLERRGVVRIVPWSSAASRSDLLIAMPIDREGIRHDLHVHRSSELVTKEWVPPGRDEAVAFTQLHGAVEIIFVHPESATGHEMMLWSKSHFSASFRYHRCAGAVFYDASAVNNIYYILYSVDCEIMLDRVEFDSDAGYRVVSTIPILKQVDSGITPRLVDAGTIFLRDNTLRIGFRTLGSAHVHRGREQPYEFWKIEDGEAVEITDDDELWRLRVEHSHKLDDEDRPTLTKQIRRPEPEPDDSASPAKPDQQDPPVPEP